MNGELEENYKRYILVTPCKNEGGNLKKLIQSVLDQTIRPVLWVIMDDGSTDNTLDILKKAKENYGWIEYVQLGEGERDLGLHYASVVKNGFDFTIDHCTKNKIKYDYLGNLDADLTLDHTFFENILNGFEKDSELGVASGGTKHIIGDRIKYAKVEEDEPSGGHMLIRRKCYEECGGYPVSFAPDSVLKAKSRLRGWKTKRFEESVATEIRDVGSAEGYWKGYAHKGKASYYLNFSPIHVIIRSIIYSFRRPYYVGIAYFMSYFINFIRRKEQIDDEEVKKYFWNKWKKAIRMGLGVK